ncbi:hypothetical protein MUY27_05395 [Mucilaginibacter sp. RS28]|uniref:Zinc-finger domain-containing protein n=1 Tax=Mucilaginibacter straminoryzae TaxID=2932774 RepID=A0A9X2BCB4_9SPHI|nr:hypothetical protein [Mucilaginibacter straminoryzae]MCJ8209133.1 hypothetical protein [Mucilaginibacter straminoryzae]
MGELKKIAYNCKKATLLIEKKQITLLTLREKLELKIHLAGCSVCRTFEKQSIMINELVKKLFDEANQKELHLDNDYKTALQQEIETRLNN